MNERQRTDLREGVLAALGRLMPPEALLAVPKAHLARRSTGRRIAKFCDEVLAGLDRPIPSDPDTLFEVLRSELERRFNEDRGTLPFRPVHLYFREFPEETASGLTARFDDRLVIIVEAQTTTLHQFVIFAHEMWHALRGECLAHESHGGVAAAAARSLGGELASDELVALAARTHVNTQEESDAEEFGLRLGARLREYLSGGGAVPITGLAGRIQSSMGRGHRA
ncbi:toxin-antitoxin system, toxin component [Streptomyces sp. NPDC088097]|uniref:toxin-antitoxin system, toxin component n=1 Tax=Streptomyces sp. NPDC088097 TaxID=3365823 RepID=UPI0038292FAA